MFLLNSHGQIVTCNLNSTLRNVYFPNLIHQIICLSYCNITIYKCEFIVTGKRDSVEYIFAASKKKSKNPLLRNYLCEYTMKDGGFKIEHIAAWNIVKYIKCKYEKKYSLYKIRKYASYNKY